MALRKKVSRRPRRRVNRRRPARRGLMSKKRNNTGEFASLSCSRTMTIVPPNPNATVTNQMYSYSDFKLSDFPRAVRVAGSYQHYRITGITLRFKPNFDTFAPGLQKQYLYYMIDKADAIPSAVTLEGLKQLGARPYVYDETVRPITWRPSVISDVEVGAGGVPSAYRVSPWLTTNANAGNPGAWNPSAVSHKGVKWYIEAPAVPPAGQTVYVEVEIQFQFKKPLVATINGATEAIKGSYPDMDASPDGVVGGTDGITIPLTSN